MYDYLIGKIKNIDKNSVTIDVNNIGYNVIVGEKNRYKLDEVYKIFIYDLIKDNTEINLYGFNEYKELSLFKILLSVNGIGPKSALQILNNSNFDQLVCYIKNKNITELNKISGVMNKGNIICYELRNKIKKFDIELFEYNDAVLALQQLGYKNTEISDALGKIESNLDLNTAIYKMIGVINNARGK